MEPTTPAPKWPIIIKYSLIWAFCSIGAYLVFYMMGMGAERGWVQNVVNLLIVGGATWFGIVGRRDEAQNGFITYGEGVGTATLMGIFSGLVVSIWTVIFMTYIDPGFYDTIIEATKKGMIEKGEPEERIEQTVYYMGKMQSPLIIGFFGIIINLVYGVIAGLILSIFAKREDPDTHYNSLDNV